MAQARRFQLPEPDFADSRELRLYLNQCRTGLHAAAMHLHMSAAEIEGALTEIRPGGDRNVLTRAMDRALARRRARRVARHMHHAAECLVAGSGAAVRTWAAFRREYAPEMAPVRGRRAKFTVVPE